jgi:signal transduction histidine kinase
MSLGSTIWLYFMIFILSIVVLMWFAFVVSVETNYKNLKTQNIIDIAYYINNEWQNDNFNTAKLDNIAYSNDMCVLIQNIYGETAYSYDMMAGNSLILGRNVVDLSLYKYKALQSSSGVYYAEITNKKFNNNTLLYVKRIGTADDPKGFIFLNTSLEPLDSTTNIIKSQLKVISILILILGLGISFFLSKLISTPITRITKSATKLAQMDYNEKFDGRGYYESETLAETLNYASAEMSKADTLRRDLIANISHDLRTPLTMVKAYAEMIRDLSGNNPEKRNEHINIIIEESDRLAALVNDILDISRLESGTMEIHKTKFNISDKLAEILDRYKLLSEQKGYTFILTLDAPVEVEADVIKIEQVIYNLINNAVNYSGEDKTIYIMQINKEKSVRIEITDTGSGISAEQLPLIFDRYYRGEKNKRDVIGTGLGLSIVKQILKQHNYEFGVCSEINVGSTFWFEILK